MFITVTLEIGADQFDIKIDEQQKIMSALEMLSKRVNMTHTSVLFWRSFMTEQIASSYKTFKEQKIITGDRLTAIL